MAATRPTVDEGANVPEQPRSIVATAAAAVAAVVAVASITYFSFRHVVAARQELVGVEVQALLAAGRLENEVRNRDYAWVEYLRSGSPDSLADLRGHAAVVRDLLRTETTRRDTAAVASAALGDDSLLHGGEERLEVLWRNARAPGGPGRPDPEAARRLEAEMLPVRQRLDLAVGEMQRERSKAFIVDRDALDHAEARALRALVATSSAAFAVGAILVYLLKRSLADLRKSERRFRTTFEHAPVGIAHVGLDGRWLRLNARYREILGYGEGELQQLTFRDVTHPEDVEKDARQSERLISGEIEGYAIEKRYLRKDGRAAWVNFTASLVRDGAGQPRFLIAAAEDIGDRKEIERQLREAVRSRDEFMQVASHELRTPLATLQLQVESLRAGVERGVDPSKARTKADAALRQVARVDALLDGLLDVARLDDASFAVRSERGDLVPMVRETVERFKPMAAREGVELRLDAPATLVATFDRGRVDQAVAALVSNAVKYGPGKPVDVRVSANGRVARISVRDRGIGIDAAQRDRIFGRFERAVSARHYGGLGLGLFVTRRIAEAHGGRVRVEAASDGGSVFVLELPLHGAEPEGPLASGGGI